MTYKITVYKHLIKQMFNFRRLLTDDNFTISDFLAANFTSENGIMVKDLVRRLYNTHNSIPDEYKQFLQDIGKMSPVSGYLQVTSPGTALDLLKVIPSNTKLIFCSIKYLLYPVTELKPYLNHCWVLVPNTVLL